MDTNVSWSQGDVPRGMTKAINSTHEFYYYTIYEYESYNHYDPCGNGSEEQNYVHRHSGMEIFINIFLPILCVSGIVGIILTVIVLSRKNMCTSTNTYLMSLAVADLGFLCLVGCRSLDRHLSGKALYSFYAFYEYAQIFIHTFLLSSVWLTVMLAVERYIAICHPLKAISICTVKRSRIIILLIFVVSFYCRVPNFFELKLETFYLCGEPVRQVVLTPLALNTTYKIIYAWIIDCAICAIIPFLFLVYLNIRLVLEIRKSTKYLRYHIGINSNMQNIVAHEQLKITMMLVSVIVAFFICQAPYVIYIAYVNIHKFSFDNFSNDKRKTFEIIMCITLFLLAVKSAFNFILYCWFSEKFWNTFKRVFCVRYCTMKHSTKRKNHTVHSADNNATSSVRKTSYLTKDTIC
ncbi:sex peptide receptor-related protein 2-like [Mytilus trossulus]|uniref:sex peptide receptor-related protein 2-like n=1 Tax=Mytilus trossulus TaxID=6551 RepID=UPI003007B8F9